MHNCGDGTMTDDVIRLREELSETVPVHLDQMKKMAEILWIRYFRTGKELQKKQFSGCISDIWQLSRPRTEQL